MGERGIHRAKSKGNTYEAQSLECPSAGRRDSSLCFGRSCSTSQGNHACEEEHYPGPGKHQGRESREEGQESEAPEEERLFKSREQELDQRFCRFTALDLAGSRGRAGRCS